MSREVTNELLAELRSGRWRPHACGRFLGRAAIRSWDMARQRSPAAAEVTVLHAALAALASRGHGQGRRDGADRGPGVSWVATSWVLSITHLGMLESRRTLGAANMVTLARANLPALTTLVGSDGARVPQATVLAAAALASDLVDGHLARRSGTTTPFGRYADSFADAAFWTWFTLRYEPSRRVRLLALGAWTVPVVAVTAISVTRGRMMDAPRPVVARPAAIMQIVLAARAAAHWYRTKVTVPRLGPGRGA